MEARGNPLPILRSRFEQSDKSARLPVASNRRPPASVGAGMRTRFLVGFLAALVLSIPLTPLVYELLPPPATGVWLWLSALITSGYWTGQAPRQALWCGAVWGWISPALLLLPEMEWALHRVTIGGGCGNSLNWAWAEITAFLFCIPAALGQVRCYLRKPTRSRLPE